ncbi:MAG: flavodoxin family protein [Actinomycetota bacterium]
MNAVVLYESVYGNTEAVARAVADGLGPAGEVTLSRFGEVPRGAVEGGGPRSAGRTVPRVGMTRAASRKRVDTESYAVGAREWLEESRPGSGKMAAAFDTRFGMPRWLTGSAASCIARRLRRSGYRLVAPPESFFVLHTAGPLRDGEDNRARAWASELAKRAST